MDLSTFQQSGLKWNNYFIDLHSELFREELDTGVARNSQKTQQSPYVDNKNPENQQQKMYELRRKLT